MAVRQKISRFSVEQTATFLALLGFLPFAFFTSLLLADPGLLSFRDAAAAGFGSVLIAALKVYSAIVLSFIGGIRWGIAITRQEGGQEETEALVLAAGPSLIGWFAFFLAEPWSFAVLAAAFAATGWWDSRSAGNKGIPEWFGRLRVLLTVLVMVTMIAAFTATY
ncbi:MAG: DUF3429 domain-containing protein [Oricola sp.]